MKVVTIAQFASVLLAGASLIAVGCEARTRSGTTVTPTTTPAAPVAPVEQDRADVKVDVGGGQGIRVDVDTDDASPRRKGADVNVQVGGPDGVRVDVDEKP